MKQPTDLQILIRLSRDDRERMEKLSERWDLSLAGVVRRAVKEAATKERI